MALFRKLLVLGGVAAGAAAVVRRRQAASSPAPAPAPAPSPAPEPGVGPAPVSVTTASPPSPEAPGPSVSPVRGTGCEAERAGGADSMTPGAELLSDRAGGPVEALVEQETNAAAAEAAGIGGRVDP